MGRIIRWTLFLLLGFYLLGILTVAPIPSEYQWFRPLWLLMFVIFCQLSQPSLFNPWVAWFIGLFLDALLGTRLGENALVFSLICYLTSLLSPKFAKRSLYLQIGKVSLLICLGQILLLWFHALEGQNPNTLLYWMGTISSCVIWPVLVLFLTGLSYLFRVKPLAYRLM